MSQGGVAVAAGPSGLQFAPRFRASEKTWYRRPAESIVIDPKVSSCTRYPFGGMHCRPAGQAVDATGPTGWKPKSVSILTGAVQLAGFEQSFAARHLTIMCWFTPSVGVLPLKNDT